MKTFYTLTFLIVLLTFTACEDNVEDFKLNLPELAFTDISISCYPLEREIVINSDSAYQAFQDYHIDDICAVSGYPNIDFTQNTLLGVQRSAVCNIGNRYWNVYHDEANKKYVFQAISEGQGNCYAMVLDRFWVTVPKLPNDYAVVFVEREY